MGGVKYLILGLLLLMGLALLVFSQSDKQLPFSILSAVEQPSPGDWIKEEQIKVYSDKVIIDLPGASWAKFTDTNSMDPFIDIQANTIEISPAAPEQINVGDVISYNTSYGILIHRVVEKGTDDEGTYYIVRGDNNSISDPFKVRFDEIEGVVVAVIY